MTFFNKLEEAAKSFTEKANDTIEITKMNAKINTEKNKITTYKTEIGDFVWQKLQHSDGCCTEVKELCAKIQASLDLIAEYERQIDDIKNEKDEKVEEVVETPKTPVCPSCGNEVNPDAKFCIECGTKLKKETKICPLCNMEQEADATVCTICGYQFEL